MKYYYADTNNEVVGPLDVESLHALFRNFKINPDTLIFIEGTENWQSYEAVFPLLAPDLSTLQNRAKTPQMKIAYPVIVAQPIQYEQPLGLRDQLIGKQKFDENSYMVSIPIPLIADEVERHFSETGFTTSRLQSNSLIEVSAKERETENPIIISITTLGEGFRVSYFDRATQLLGYGVITGAIGLLFPPALLLGAGLAAANAGIERREKALFWTFIEAKIEELAASATKKPSADERHDTASEIERLWNLKQQGALTQAEFDARKKTLLASS